MQTKYTNSIDDDVAIMMLYGEIGGPDLSAEYFTQEMRYHNQMGRKTKVYINSPGGNVFGGYSIIQAIMDYEADTHVVGLAASMAGIILQFGKKRTANDFAVGMIHMPTQSGKKKDKLLNTVSDSLLSILESRCTKTRDELEALMKDETFFDASEMLDIGFIDEVVSTNVAVDTQDLITNHAEVGDLYNIYNNLITNTEMKKVKEHFKLSANATEDEVLNSIAELETAINNLNEELSVAKTENSTLQTELEAVRTENTEVSAQIANLIVDNAIDDGKIEKNKKDIWLDAAKKDAKSVQAQLESISAAPVNSLESVQTTILHKKSPDTKPEDNIKEWVKNNGAELLKLEQDDPDEFNRIMDLYEEKAKQ